MSKLADQVTNTFIAESKIVFTVDLIGKRFEIGKLIGNVSSLLGAGTYDMLPDIARLDMDEAGKCIALDRATAAAFHTLRATEAMLKELYLQIVKRGRLKRPMWADMVNALRKRKLHKPDPSLLDLLDMIRTNYRNPTQHPEKVYDIDEAQDLFANCISAQNMISKEIKHYSESK